MRVKLYYFLIPDEDYARIYPGKDYGMMLMERLGSQPRKAGEVVEGITVPDGFTMLFPMNENKLRSFLSTSEVRFTYHEKWCNV